MQPAPFYYFFYDFHTMAACPDVGRDFDARAFAGNLAEAGCDYVIFPAKCNQGNCYFGTKVGRRHPSLEFDLIGRMTEACVEAGVRIGAYLNVGLSHNEGLENRGWLRIAPDGHVYAEDRLGHFFRTMCFNTSYAEHILDLITELLSLHPLSGLFLDSMGARPCVGVECVREMKERGLDWRDPADLHEFARLTALRMARRIAGAAGEVRDDLLFVFNGIPYEHQLDVASHLEIECLPSHGGWGYEYLPVFARYARTLGKPVSNMTGRFHVSWGDFGGLRTEPSLTYDLLQGLAYGTAPCIGDHLHPRAALNKPVEAMKGRVFARLRELDPWTRGAKPVVEAAVVAPRGSFDGLPEVRQEAMGVLKGAARMLAELQVQLDIVSQDQPWREYDLLVLPDITPLDDALAERVRAHLDGGGKVLSTGWAGLDPERKGFVLDAWGVRYAGDEPCSPAYLEAAPALRGVLPEMPVTLYESGVALEAGPDAETLAEIVAPYYNREFDGEHYFGYQPPDKPAGRPAVTLAGGVAHFASPLFTLYYRHAPVVMRDLLAAVLDRLLPARLVRVEALPSFARVMLTEQPGRRMAHVLAYLPEPRGDRMSIIEEPIGLRGVRVGLRVEGKPPTRVYLAPSEEPLDTDTRDGYTWATVPEVEGYAMVVFEEG